MNIGGRDISPHAPTYVIAEIGVNHDGDPRRALDLTDAAADAGADAIKLQYFETDRLMSAATRLAAYQRAAGESDPVAMLRRLELPLDAMARIVDRAHERRVHAIVSIFSRELVPGAGALPFDAYKTASPDIINDPLLAALAATGRPLIVSTGAAEPSEVRRAYTDHLGTIADRVAMLQCVSCYPTDRGDAAIAGMLDLVAELPARGGALGYSDHTADLDTGALARRIGACVLEKHLTYDRSARGPDHAASLEPDQLAEYVRRAKSARVELPPGAVADSARLAALLDADPAYGPPVKRVLGCERDVRAVSRQRLVAARPLVEGHTLGDADVTTKRSPEGAPPDHLAGALGRTLTRSLDADDPIVLEDLR